MDINITPSMDIRFAQSVMESRPGHYVALEIDPVSESQDCEADGRQIQVDHDNPEFYSVYLRGKDGLAYCVGDQDTHELALAYALEIGRAHRLDVHDHVSGCVISIQPAHDPATA